MDIKDYIDYNPDTGIFTYKKIPKYGKKKIGDKIGTLSSQGYLQFAFNGKIYLLHRLAFYLCDYKIDSNYVVDHINQIKTDNRWCNLRIATKSLNAINSKSRNSRTGHRNIYFNANLNKYEIRVMRNNVSTYYGLFETLEKAKESHARLLL